MEASGNLLHTADKKEIVSRLQKELLRWQGIRNIGPSLSPLDLGPIDLAFPHQCFPTSAIHEFIATGHPSRAATTGFVACLLASLMQHPGIAVWINSGQMVFPPGLERFGLSPERIFFIHLRNKKEILWVTEEVLKCEGVAAVIAEIPALDFTQSRRLQLAVEKSNVTGFVITDELRAYAVNACMARWKISPVPSAPEGDMPGLGLPRWNVQLMKIRNGKPGNWQMEWTSKRLQQVPSRIKSIPAEQKRRTG